MAGVWNEVISPWPTNYDPLDPNRGFQAIHLIHLYTGKYLAIDHANQAIVWDPSGSFVAVANTPARLFCSGHCQMADGRNFIAGGDFEEYTNDRPALKKAYIFDPAASPTGNPWTTLHDMAEGRYYPTCTTMPDGKVLVSAGQTTYQSSGSQPMCVRLERYDPIGAPSAAPTRQNATWERRQLLYPYMHVMPNGDVYDSGPDGGDHRALNSGTEAFPNTSWSYGASDPIWGEGGLGHGSATMYRIAKVLKCGGSALENNPGTRLGAYTDRSVLPGAMPQWLPSGDPGGFQMVRPRRNHNLVLLPDGKVMCVGGNENGAAYKQPAGNTSPNAWLKPEIWNPDASGTPAWTELDAPMTDPRYYHSTAMLMRDARVISAGGERDPTGDAGPVPYSVYSAQLFNPPYLDGDPLRPVITNAPAVIQYGPRTIQIDYEPEEADVSKGCLIRLGSTTHGFDMDQRFIPLSAGPTQVGLNYVRFTINFTGNVAPPGYYMLFLRSAAGAPCTEAKYVRIGP